MPTPPPVPQDAPPTPPRWLVVGVLLMGVLVVSTAAILVRSAIAAANTRGVGFSLFLSATRLTLAALLLSPTWGNLRQLPPTSRSLTYAIAAGVCLAGHFAAWTTSLSYTSIAASTTLVTTNPIWVALFSWIGWREIPTRLTLVGIAIALSGGMLVGWNGGEINAAASQPILGNFLALVGAWTVSLYLLLGREAQRQGMSTQSYGLVAYAIAAVVLLPLPALFGIDYLGYPPAVYGYTLLMALLPQLIGHTSLNWALRWLSPTLVTLMILFEPVIASYMGYLVFGEVPGPFVLLGAGILLVGVAIAAIGNRKI